MGTFADIGAGLIRYVESFATIPVSVPNRVYDGTKDYYRVTILPAFTGAFGLNSTSRHDGLLQIDIIVKKDTGIQTAYEYVDTILSKFVRPFFIVENNTRIRFTRPGYPGPPIPGVADYMIPVTIPYTVLTGD